jgi:hypothetical protein
MRPGFPLKAAFAAVSFYAFVTILFLDGKSRDDAGNPPRIAERTTPLPAPVTPVPSN